MSTEDGLYLSRARLRHDAPTATLRELLSASEHARTAAAHQLIWTLFADAVDRERDFLWREAEPGTFFLLSARRPIDRRGLFHVDEPKPFAPALAQGDRLDFVLRANATVARKSSVGAGPEERMRGKRNDVVMDALYTVARGERAHMRQKLLPGLAAEWLRRQGETHGFDLAERAIVEDWEIGAQEAVGQPALTVDGYRVLRVSRGRGARPMQIGMLDLEGTLVVREPATFVTALRHGLGRAKAFGCGLMLVRRSR
jgi:CRISPR system Cascade subunit CasE